MQKQPELFDPKSVAMHRARAGRGQKPALFLHEFAADCIYERLKEINRTFTNPVFVGWNADTWQRILEIDAKCIDDKPVLDIAEDSHDLIIHGLSLHWANDPVGQMVQMRRALRPDGLMLAVMFGGQTLNELRSAMAEAETLVENGISPRVAPMAEIRDLGGLIQRAGLALPVADSVTLNVEYETPIHLMNDLRMMGETNALTARRKSLRRETLAVTNELYSKNFQTNDGRINATFELVFLTGWAPSDTQQKPMRPGSAQQRLSDALGTTERKP